MPLALQADLTLVDDRLVPGVVVRIGRDGCIASVEGAGVSQEISTASELVAHRPGAEVSPPSRTQVHRLRGRILLPGFVNAHSHAFQRLLRGRTEHRAHGSSDDFWSWREAMYRATEMLRPEEIEAVSRFAFLEMKLAGFTHVVEFHYLHNQQGGRRYADPNEISRRVLEAAAEAGIGITLLRVAYQRGGPGQPAVPPQLRFIEPDAERFLEDTQSLASFCSLDRCRPVQVGIAAHSVRALSVPYLKALAAGRGGCIVHAHVSEQPKEVQACMAETGRRPLELLDECGLVDSRFTAVHATHLGPGEAERLGRKGAGACICPTTERNLGDGLPDLEELLAAGAFLAIGSDSQVRIDPFAELRMLEDGERLRSGRRNVLAPKSGQEVAPVLIRAGAEGGARAAGLKAGRIAPGQRADLVSLDLDDPALVGLAEEEGDAGVLLSNIVLGGHPRMVKDLWIGGRQEVHDGECLRWARAAEEYKAVGRRIFGRG